MENSLADLRADCVALAIPSPVTGCILVLARGSSFPDAPELVPVSAGGGTLCRKVLKTGQDVTAHIGPRDVRCGLMAAEELTSYCGTPVFSQDGAEVLASVAAMSRMSRIWSLGDIDRLHDLAQALGQRGLPVWASADPKRSGHSRG